MEWSGVDGWIRLEDSVVMGLDGIDQMAGLGERRGVDG